MPDTNQAPREQWGSKAGFVLATVSSAVGLGNIWRFPYMAYDNGGGAFLLPYLFAVFTAGIPLVIMEFCLGKRTSKAAPGALAFLGRGGRFLGWWQVLICFSIMVYYSVVLAWTCCYIYFAASGAWGADPQAFFLRDFLGATKGLGDMGHISWGAVAGLVLVWLCIWLVNWRGIKRGIEAASKVFMPLLALLLLAMLIMALDLPGAAEGVNWLFQPDFSHLTDYRVWADAYSQVFYSASVFFAIMIAYSSYLPEDADINGSAFTMITLNSGFSLLAGTMIFAILGSLAHGRGVPMDEVAGSGIILAFVTVPAAVDIMPMPRLTGVLFFGALFVAGVSSLISLAEAVVSPLIRATGWGRHKVVSLVCLVSLALSLAYAWGSGLHLIDLADHFLSNYGLICVGLVELLLFAWLSGRLAEMRRFANSTSDFAIGRWWDLALRWVNPVFLATTIFFLTWDDLRLADSAEFSPASVGLGLGLITLTMVLAAWATRLDRRAMTGEAP